MSRIFTFGCSLTAYAWPTWATILAYDLKTPVYNFANPGMGNVGIYHTIMYANLRYKFTKDDKILILWSSWSREDRIKNKKWCNSGGIFAEAYFDRKFIKKHWDIDNDIVKNATAIISANQLFKDNIVWQGNWIEPFVPEGLDEYDRPSKNAIALYKSAMPDIKVYQLDGVEIAFGGLIQDSHPDVRRHMKFTKDVILPVFGKTMDVDTENKFNEVHNKIMILVKSLAPSHRGDLNVYLQEIMKLMNSMPELSWHLIRENMNDFLAN